MVSINHVDPLDWGFDVVVSALKGTSDTNRKLAKVLLSESGRSERFSVCIAPTIAKLTKYSQGKNRNKGDTVAIAAREGENIVLLKIFRPLIISSKISRATLTHI